MVTVVTLDQRPDLLGPALDLGGVGAEFMQHDPIGLLASARLIMQRWPEFFAVVLDEGEVVARAVSVPFAFGIEGREELPDHGWDGVLLWAVDDHLRGRTPSCVGALDIQVSERRRGEGLSAVSLQAMRDNAARLGFAEVLAPVRPTNKAAEPLTDMAEYVGRTRADGLPEDPWIRVHVRAGGEIAKVAPFSMTIHGTLAEWRHWTGLPFDEDGLVVVDGGLAPVVVSKELNLGVYVEPNVWIRHAIT